MSLNCENLICKFFGAVGRFLKRMLEKIKAALPRRRAARLRLLRVSGGWLILGDAAALRSQLRNFYAGAPQSSRLMSLWQAPEQDALLERLLAEASLCGLLLLHDRPRAGAIVIPCCSNSRTAHIHFMATPPVAPNDAPAEALREAEELRQGCRAFVAAAQARYKVLTCAIPRHWRGARLLAEATGFVKLATFPGAALAWLDADPWLVDLVLYMREG